MKRTLKTFGRNERGLAALEFALMAPILLMLFMGAVELTRYVIIAQKAEKAAVTMSDLVAQSETIGTSDLNILVQAVGEVMQPLSFGANGQVFVSSVSRVGSATPIINWQYVGGGSLSGTNSQIGFVGGSATLPSDFALDPNEGIIIAEVYYSYTPLFANTILPPSIMYKVGVFKPRLGELTSLGS